MLYEELVATLRDHNAVLSVATTDEAADAIEELAAFKAQITDGHFYCMRDGVLYEAKVEAPKGKTIQLPRIEYEEGE